MSNPSELELFKEVFELSEEFPSGLKWKITVTNRAKAGNMAGSLKNHGYWSVGYKGKSYPVHRIVCALATNKDCTDLTVDHIDRNRGNNCPENLRWATKSEQGKNRERWGWKYCTSNN
jgi:hypothetical protein